MVLRGEMYSRLMNVFDFIDEELSVLPNPPFLVVDGRLSDNITCGIDARSNINWAMFWSWVNVIGKSLLFLSMMVMFPL